MELKRRLSNFFSILFISVFYFSCNDATGEKVNKGYSIQSQDYPNNFHKGKFNKFSLTYDKKKFGSKVIYISADTNAVLVKNNLDYSVFSKKDSATIFFVIHEPNKSSSIIMEEKRIFFK